MAKTYLFRLTSEGVDKLQRDLEALGPTGARAFQAMSEASTSLARAVAPASAQVDALRTKLQQVSTTANETGGIMRRYGTSIQQAGYQIGDFAVQLASGQDPMRAFIQQGTQLVSMFGPWGAIIGAAGATIGALATSFLGLEDSTKKAEAAQKAHNEALERSIELYKKVRGEQELTKQGALAALRNEVARAEEEYKQALAKFSAIPDREKRPQIGPRAIGLAGTQATPRAQQAQAEVTAALRYVQTQRSILDAGLDEKEQRFRDAQKAFADGRKPSDDAQALDKYIASLQKEAELAGLSGKAHAERAAIMRAEEIAQEKGLDLTNEQRVAIIAAADAEYERTAATEDGTAAQREAEKQAKDHAKATSDATRALTEQVAGLQEETYQLGLSDRERYIRQQVLRAEQQVLRGAIENGQDYVDQVEREAGVQFDAAKAVKDREKVEQDATRAAEKQANERQKIVEREAELMLEPAKNAIQGIQSAGVDMWEKIFGGEALTSASDFFGALKQMGIRWAAEMAELWTIRPVAGGLLNGIAPGLAASLGFSGSAAAQNAGVSGIGSGGFGSFAASASPLAAMLGGAGGATGGLGSWLFGGGAPVMSNGIQVGTSGGGLFGSMPGLAGFLNSGLGTGLVGAALSAGVSLASGGSALQAGISGGGSLLGGLAGSVFGQPVLGAALGGIAGNIISSLFGKKEKKPPKQQSITDISALSSGYFGAGGTTTKNSGDVTSGLGRDASNALNAFLASIGGSVSGALPGQNQLLYYGRTPRYMSVVGGVNNQYGEDAQGAQDAVADFIARTMVAAAKSDRLEGVSNAVRTAIANSGAKDAEALDAAVAFGKFYDRVDQIREPADAAAKAMSDLAAEMAKAQASAEEYGLDVAKIPEIFRQNFTDDILNQILQLKDPTAYALKQMELERAAALAQATSLGADINAVEELYGLKRQAIVEQGLQSVTSSFQDFFNSLLTDSNLSALSPQEQYKVTKAAFEGASNDNLISAASPFLQASRGMYASSKSYADDFRAVLERIKAAGGLTSDIPAFAAGGEHAGGWMMVGENGPELIASGAARVYDAKTTAAIMSAANADLSPKLLAGIVRSFGEGPDTELVHMRPDELAAAMTWWGGMTYNPVDGLPSFHGGGMGGGASRGGSSRGGNSGSGRADRDQQSNRTADRAQSAMGSGGKGSAGGSFSGAAKQQTAPLSNPAVNPSNKNLGLAGPDYSGPTGTGTGVDRNNPANAPGKMSDKGGGAWDTSFGPPPTSPMSSDGFYDASKVNTPNGPVDADKFAHDWADYHGLQYGDLKADTFWDSVGNFFASWAGFNEINPLEDPTYNTPENPAGFGATWGFDPAGLIGSLAGMAVGLPFGGGILGDLISRVLGRPLEIPIGPSVFGAPDNPMIADGVSNALAVQGASDIAIGGASFSANPSASGGVLSSGDIPRALSNVVSGGGQNSVTGSLQSGFDRTAKGNEALLLQVQTLININREMSSQLQNLQNEQSLTNQVLKTQARGTNKI
jgi:hypothetical protein